MRVFDANLSMFARTMGGGVASGHAQTFSSQFRVIRVDPNRFSYPPCLALCKRGGSTYAEALSADLANCAVHWRQLLYYSLPARSIYVQGPNYKYGDPMNRVDLRWLL